MSFDSLLRSLFHRIKNLPESVELESTNSRNNHAMARIYLFQNCNKKSAGILKMWIDSYTIDVGHKLMGEGALIKPTSE